MSVPCQREHFQQSETAQHMLLTGVVTGFLPYPSEEKSSGRSMRRVIVAVILLNSIIAFRANVAYAQDSLDVWREFVSVLIKGELPEEKIRPYRPSLRGPLLGFLRQMSEKATWKEWEANPEVHRTENRIQYLIPLTFDNQKGTYCFSFLVEGEKWYFQHLEYINDSAGQTFRSAGIRISRSAGRRKSPDARGTQGFSSSPAFQFPREGERSRFCIQLVQRWAGICACRESVGSIFSGSKSLYSLPLLGAVELAGESSYPQTPG